MQKDTIYCFKYINYCRFHRLNTLFACPRTICFEVSLHLTIQAGGVWGDLGPEPSHAWRDKAEIALEPGEADQAGRVLMSTRILGRPSTSFGYFSW